MKNQFEQFAAEVKRLSGLEIEMTNTSRCLDAIVKKIVIGPNSDKSGIIARYLSFEDGDEPVVFMFPATRISRTTTFTDFGMLATRGVKDIIGFPSYNGFMSQGSEVVKAITSSDPKIWAKEYLFFVMGLVLLERACNATKAVMGQNKDVLDGKNELPTKPPTKQSTKPPAYNEY